MATTLFAFWNIHPFLPFLFLEGYIQGRYLSHTILPPTPQDFKLSSCPIFKEMDWVWDINTTTLPDDERELLADFMNIQELAGCSDHKLDELKVARRIFSRATRLFVVTERYQTQLLIFVSEGSPRVG